MYDQLHMEAGFFVSYNLLHQLKCWRLNEF